MSTSAIQLWDGEDRKIKTLKSGAVSETYLNRKEYGKVHGLKGAALRRAHDQYRMNRGVKANGGLAALMTSGQVVLEKLTTKANGNGFTAGFTFAREFGAADPRTVAATLSDDELMAIMEERKAKQQASAQKPAEQPQQS